MAIQTLDTMPSFSSTGADKSLVAMFARARAELLRSLDIANRDATADEQDLLTAYGIGICYASAVTDKDAHHQIVVSMEFLELYSEGVAPIEYLDAAVAAGISAAEQLHLP
ncbi:MAG TPA: hypothetical protein VKS60_26370 [Stellaceae bacterium]|nr:hypothetical protein [Stellaceae bacterium]